MTKPNDESRSPFIIAYGLCALSGFLMGVILTLAICHK